jgi:hypothetical protein
MVLLDSVYLVLSAAAPAAAAPARAVAPPIVSVPPRVRYYCAGKGSMEAGYGHQILTIPRRVLTFCVY